MESIVSAEYYSSETIFLWSTGFSFTCCSYIYIFTPDVWRLSLESEWKQVFPDLSQYHQRPQYSHSHDSLLFLESQIYQFSRLLLLLLFGFSYP